MKRLFIILSIFLASTAIVRSQNLDDALRYSQIFYGGTARFTAMGGAFTALGADLSTFSQNPAGIGVFRSSEMSITPQLDYIKTSASYNGTVSTEYLDNFNLGQAGMVSTIFSGNNTSGLITFNFGYSFNKTNNYDQIFIIQGTNQTSSMADYWAEISDGTFYKDLSGAEGIAYDSWVIDDSISISGVSSYGTVYSNYLNSPTSIYGQKVRRLVSYDGYTGEHAITFGGNYSNKLYFGATFGISQLRYVNHYEHLESTDKSMASGFKNFTYTDHFENEGVGFGFKLGAIYKPVEYLRVGAAFHSPVWYTIKEYFYEDMSSSFTGENHEYYNDPLRYEYALATPLRFLSGIAVQVKKMGVISFDYEYVDYSAARFSQTGDGYNYTEKNNAINSSLKATSNFRVGGELRLNKLYLRSGYAYYGSAYEKGEDNQDLDYSSISGGIGFREKNLSIDFGYSNFRYSQTYFLYPLQNISDAADAYLSTTKNIFSLTVGFKFGN
jgi:hypothetical protein